MDKNRKYGFLRKTLIDQRTTKGFTQVEIAKRLGKPQSFVSKYESGERRLDLIEFIEVCKSMSIKPIVIINILENINE